MSGVITGANGAVLSSDVYDAFMGMQYVQGVSKTTQPATCFKAMSEPNILTGSGGRGVVVPSRGFQVMGKKPAPVKKQACQGIAPIKKSGIPSIIIGIRIGWCLYDIIVDLGKDCLASYLKAAGACQACLVAAFAACDASPLFCAAFLEACADTCDVELLDCLKDALPTILAGILQCAKGFLRGE